MSTLVPAQIKIKDSELAGGSRNFPREPIKVQFNPTEYTLSKSAQIAEIAIPGLDSPILQFVRGQNEKLTLDLFFDTTREGMGDNVRDVRELTRPVYQLVKIQPETHALPRITFSWGEGLSFHAVVESIQQKFGLFNAKGIPLRATLSVTFRQYRTLEEQLKELDPQSSDRTSQHVVQAGETITQIAYQVYGDSAAWRPIADENRIANPRLLSPGASLEIPPLN